MSVLAASAPIVRTLVLWCPDWPITAALREPVLSGTVFSRTSPGNDDALALIDHGTVFACSAAARREGVARGLRVREAQARCPELVVQPYDAVRDNRAFEVILAAVEEMMPGVQLLRPGTCALRVRGPARYYGGERPAALALIALLTQIGIPGARVGIADGPFTAEQAAHATNAAHALDTGHATSLLVVPEGRSAEFLGPLPVSLLGQPDLVTLLRRLGVTTLAGFAALPLDDVRGRFGETGAYLHALASGLDSRPVIQRIPPEELDSAIEFEPPLDRIDQVTFGFRAPADHFIEGLIDAQLVCTSLRIEIDTESGEVSERSWLHPRSFTAADVVDRVRWQLQGSGEVDEGLHSAITRVRVIPESVDAIGNHEVGLFGTGPDERIHHGLSRVQSMLGHGGVRTAVISGGRTLADRQATVPWGDRPLVTRSPGQPWPGQLPSPAPSTVFPVPRPVHVLGASGETVEVDDRGILSTAPAQFSATGAGRDLRRITAWAGPWPVDERWWDADTHRRAHRFQVVDATGMAWLLVLHSNGWWAEARYD
jgi:protein ImuB